MHNAAWVKLLQHIPLSEQAKLMLVTASGTEITIQCLLRIDPECLALKGRLAGSQDAGRVFFVPYAHIDYFGFQQPLKESDFHELFGNLEIPHAAAPRRCSTGDARRAGASRRRGGPFRLLSAIRWLSNRACWRKFRSRSLTNPGTMMRPPVDE